MAHRLVDQRQPLGDHLGVPQRAILIVEQDDLPVGIVTRGRARVLQQKQRGQPHDLGLGREQPQQQPREADRFVAQRGAALVTAAGWPNSPR